MAAHLEESPVKILASALLLFAAACATTPPMTASNDPAASSGPSDYWSQPPPPGEDPLVCEERMETGSHIAVKKCHKKSELDTSRAAVQSQMLTPRPRTAQAP
jgi:hypothetical protein